MEEKDDVRSLVHELAVEFRKLLAKNRRREGDTHD